MLVMGHTGITLGIAVLLSGAFSKNYSLPAETDRKTQQLGQSTGVLSSHKTPAGGRPSWLTFLATNIDIRVLLIGSLLPDIIDKPIGQYFFRETFNSGRIFGHTLLFLILITAAGYYLYRSRGKTWLLALSFGTFFHLILDQIWLMPETLLWPLYGFTFVEADLSNWAQGILYALLNNPEVYIPEAVGIVVLLSFMAVLVRRKSVYLFIRSGQV